MSENLILHTTSYKQCSFIANRIMKHAHRLSSEYSSHCQMLMLFTRTKLRSLCIVGHFFRWAFNDLALSLFNFVLLFFISLLLHIRCTYDISQRFTFEYFISIPTVIAIRERRNAFFDMFVNRINDASISLAIRKTAIKYLCMERSRSCVCVFCILNSAINCFNSAHKVDTSILNHGAFHR